jgi:hypothetical protein
MSLTLPEPGRACRRSRSAPEHCARDRAVPRLLGVQALRRASAQAGKQTKARLANIQRPQQMGRRTKKPCFGSGGRGSPLGGLPGAPSPFESG